MSEWFYAVAREQRGPVDEQGIRTLIAEGTLQGNSPVWKEGLPQWVRLDKTDLSRFLVVSPPLPDESATEEQARPEGQAINLNLSGLPTKFQHEYTTDSVFG